MLQKRIFGDFGITFSNFCRIWGLKVEKSGSKIEIINVGRDFGRYLGSIWAPFGGHFDDFGPRKSMQKSKPKKTRTKSKSVQ